MCGSTLISMLDGLYILMLHPSLHGRKGSFSLCLMLANLDHAEVVVEWPCTTGSKGLVIEAKSCTSSKGLLGDVFIRVLHHLQLLDISRVIYRLSQAWSYRTVVGAWSIKGRRSRKKRICEAASASTSLICNCRGPPNVPMPGWLLQIPHSTLKQARQSFASKPYSDCLHQG